MTRWSVPRRGHVEVVVPSSPEEVYAVLADVTRVAEWSHECRGAVWLDGATVAAVGARFRGTNKVGRVGWSRCCTVTAADPGRAFAYRTNGGTPADSTSWSFELRPAGAGTRVVQRFEILEFARWVDLLTFAFVPAHRDRSAALRADLVRLGEVSRAPSR